MKLLLPLRVGGDVIRLTCGVAAWALGVRDSFIL